VTDDTVKAVEQREAVPIAARKQQLMVQAARIAKLAADRPSRHREHNYAAESKAENRQGKDE
jgi:hypothetical protein